MKRPVWTAAVCLAAFLAVWLRFLFVPSDTLEMVSEKGEIIFAEEGDLYIATGRVTKVEWREYTDYSTMWIYLDGVTLEDEAGNTGSISCGLICLTDGRERPRIGSLATLRGKFASYTKATNPGQFDSAQYYRILGIGGKLKSAELLETGEGYNVLWERFYLLREHWKEKLYSCYAAREASVLCAMLLGDRTGLDEEWKSLYQNNGIAHILSISGLHITLIGMGLCGILKKTGCPGPVAAIAGAVVLVWYGLLVGMPVSACRAIGMYLLKVLGELLGRTYDMLTALGVMAIVLLLGQPEYLLYGGFALSFGAIAGIALVLPALQPAQYRPREKTRGRDSVSRRLRDYVNPKIWVGYIGTLLAPGIAILLFTLPIQLYFYYEVPVYATLLNVLVLPPFGLLVGTGLCVMLCPGMGWLAFVGTAIFKWYEALCRLFDTFPFHTWTPGCPSAWQMALYYLLLFAFLGLRKWMGKEERLTEKWRLLPFALPVAAVLVLGISVGSGLRITFLDVGQGDSIVIRTQGGEVYVFDCGSTSYQSVGENILIPFLKYNGITHIDGVFLSHPDQDHYSGIVELLEEGAGEGISIDWLFLPDIAEDRRKEELGVIWEAWESACQADKPGLRYLGKGAVWRSGETVFTCLHPDNGSTLEDANAYSQCFLVENGSFSLLLTGDVEGEGETMLLEALQEEAISGLTVLKVAHHGSRNSTSAEILSLLHPRAAIISCGLDNSYGHPHEELLMRLTDVESTIYVTATEGAVTLTVKEDHVKIQGFLK